MSSVPRSSPETATLPREARVVRVFMIVGVATAAVLALLLGLQSESRWRDAAPAPLGLALMFALLALRPRLVPLNPLLALGVVGTAIAAWAVARISGAGVQSAVLAFVPLLVCAAGCRLPPAWTVALGAAQAAALVLVTQAGQWLDWTLQVALLVAGGAIGILMRSVMEHTLSGLKAREQRFRGLLEMAADVYWETDAEHRFTLASKAGGVPDAAAGGSIGKQPWELEHPGIDDDAIDANRADFEARRAFSNFVVCRRRSNGMLRWYSVNGRPRFDARNQFVGYWGVSRDITDERESELARQATEARFRELFARSPSPLVLHGDGRILMANQAAAWLLGVRDVEELTGAPLLDFYDEADGSRARAALRLRWLDEVPTGDSAPPQEFSLQGATGRRLQVQVTSVKVEADGRTAVLSIYHDQTERLRSEAARVRSEALLSQVVATSPDLITLTDRQTGRYVMVNDAFCRLTGWTREEVLGRTAGELGVWGDEGARDDFVRALDAAGQLRDRAIVFRVRDGAVVTLQVSAAVFTMEGREYLVLNGRDVTQVERERLEREAILQNASIGIAMTRERTFQLANPAFEQMFGWPPGTLAGQPGEATAVDADDYDALGRQYGPALSRGEVVEFERRMKRRDGSTFLCRLLATPVDSKHPSQGGTIWIAEDVTERRAVEAELARTRDEAEAANRAKSAFLANTSHEIRTPLNGLVGLARLARQPGLEAQRREQYLAQIDESAQALAGVISDILDLSKIEAGRLSLETIDFDLHALLESIEQGYRALAETRSLALTMTVADAVPRRVRGDPLRVRQVLSNFLSNAVKFTERGGVRVGVMPAAPGQLRFEVADSGPGIEADMLPRLFEPFTQADGSTTRRYGGTGLGLSICRELAVLMGGRVGVASEPGRGSLFWAELPLAASESAAPVPDAGAAAPGSDAALVGLRVLLAEDNPVNMMIGVALLEQWGVEVAQAGDGADAVAAVAAAADAGQPFDLVLMDLQMPVQGGQSATRELRRRFDAAALPVIALTAAALTQERDEALAAGMNDFLTKPIDADRLRETLLRWRALRRAA